MEKGLRIASGVFGLVFVLIMLRWIVDPHGAAEALQMTLLDGPGRNSQLGDTTAYFTGLAVFALYGVWKEKRDFMIAAIVLIVAVAVFRVLGGLVHDAPTIWSFVVIEAVTAAIWTGYARTLKS